MTALACKVCTPRDLTDQNSEHGCTCLAACGQDGCTGSREVAKRMTWLAARNDRERNPR